MKIRTRFAPSPTGNLHIGGVRTALFNYLFAKKHQGEFLLRIEDTDKARSTKEAIDVILNGLAWLDLKNDGTVVFQSQNEEKHKEIAQKLLNEGKAYYCTCQDKQTETNTYQKYNRICREKNIKSLQNGEKAVVRLKAPLEGTTVVNDIIKGKIEIENKELDDMVLLRSDGTPTYMLAVVVDDINMQITHIIRGDDHLTNTFRQLQLYYALGATPPYFAHLPLILSGSGAKLSKREDSVSLMEYKEKGFLNVAICNYLLRLGWNHENLEIIDRKTALAFFSLEEVHKSAAKFDIKKLLNINSHYLKHLDNETLLQYFEEFVQSNIKTELLADNYKTILTKIAPFVVKRAETLMDLVEKSHNLLIKEESLKYSKETIEETDFNLLKTEEEILKEIAQKNWNREELMQTIGLHGEKINLKLGQMATPLRYALVNSKNSPASVFDIMEILGKEKSLLRIQNLMHQA